jgi:hypothetical protein
MLRLAAASRTVAEFAPALFVSRWTVTIHAVTILAKLGVTTRTRATSVAVHDDAGLTTPAFDLRPIRVSCATRVEHPSPAPTRSEPANLRRRLSGIALRMQG